MSEPALFDVDAGPAPGRDAAGLSYGQRLTIRQREAIRRGRHPLFGLPLHPDAPRDAAPTDRGRDHTCGTCVFREYRGGGHARDYPKCFWPGRPPYSRETSGPATDVRAWWPACTDYKAGQ